MSNFTSTLRAAGWAALFGAAAAWLPAASATSPPPAPHVKSALVQVDVYDRFDLSALPVHTKDGRQYIVGAPGHEYAVRIRNCTGGRVLVVTSVDGVNVISGDTASPAQSGYVLEPWGSAEIAGWRKSMERTAAFYFTDLGDSYAARTGRPQNVGVIGVAVFPEKAPTRMSWREEIFARKQAAAENDAQSGAGARDNRAEAPAAGAPAAPAPSASSAQEQAEPKRERAALDEMVAQSRKDDVKKSLGKLGTGHGRNEESRVSVVQFERASSTPAEVVTVQYDRRENLIALGVLREPRPYLARRTPDPFPAAMRFAPDPLR
ncbi:MAG: hypothetical protein ABIO63_11580 [Casimicrobiaceae bacterium]